VSLGKPGSKRLRRSATRLEYTQIIRFVADSRSDFSYGVAGQTGVETASPIRYEVGVYSNHPFCSGLAKRFRVTVSLGKRGSKRLRRSATRLEYTQITRFVAGSRSDFELRCRLANRVETASPIRYEVGVCSNHPFCSGLAKRFRVTVSLGKRGSKRLRRSATRLEYAQITRFVADSRSDFELRCRWANGGRNGFADPLRGWSILKSSVL